MRHTPASKALAKYTVIDLTRARAGPTAVRQLADWGAQVIKIEMPGSDDTPDFMDRHSPDFQNLHRNKRSMTLNLKSPEGRDIFKQLARHADVIVENYRPDVKHRLGIDYAAIKAINPRTLILDSRVLCDQQLNERTQQRFASLSDIVHKLKETEVKREFLL